MKFRKILFSCLVLCAALSVAFCIAACDNQGNNNNTDNTDISTDTYTVSYERGSAEATGDIPQPQSYAAGDKVILAVASTFSLEGYTFEKWSDGTAEYSAGSEFTMPAHNVTFTAVWKAILQEPIIPPIDDKDEPTLTELDSSFYDAENWEYMTNDNGASSDIGDKPYILADGSIKFHRANQAIEIGNLSNSTASFMLKGTNDWNIWLNSSTKDNKNNSSYRLVFIDNTLKIVISSDDAKSEVVVNNSGYNKGEWNRFDIAFSTNNNVCEIKLYINEQRAELAAVENVQSVSIEDNILRHVQPADFKTGNYIVVKVWSAADFVQFKPVAKAAEPDVPVIAAIGASITAGANADNFYTESYPAQLQNLLGGQYNVVNFGNSGKTVTSNPQDGEPWFEQVQWKGVQAIKPDIIIVNIGTNDSKPDNFTDKATFKNDYEYFINTIKAVNPDMDIYICTVPYAYSNSYKISNDNIRDTIAVVQREVAQENNYHLVDLYEYSQNKSLIFDDGIHPHSIGYGMFAEIIGKMITEGDNVQTEDYLESINAKYNDKVSDYSAKIEVVDDKINLTVSGNTTLSESAEIKVRLRVDTDKYLDYNAVISGGKFSAAIDLTGLENAYYNIRVYVYDETYYPVHDSFYHLMLMSESEYSAGNIFHNSEKQVKLASWSSGWGSTLSIASIGDYNYVNITSSVISKIDSKQTLTLKGTTNDEGIRLYVGQHPTNEGVYRQYNDVTVENGQFETSFNLNSMPVGGWYNVRIYFSDGTYSVVPLSETTDGIRALKSGDVFYCETTKINIVTWTDSGVGTLSFNVAEYDGSYTVTAEDVRFEDGKFIFSGTVENVQTLYVYLINTNVSGTLNNYVEADIAQDGTFTATFSLSKIADISGALGQPLNLRYKVNDITSATVNVLQGDMDLSQEYNSGNYTFTLGLNGSTVRVRFSNRTYNYDITSASIAEADGKAMLTLAGTVDSDVAAENITLLLDKTSATTQQITLTNMLTEDGTFSFTYDISQLKYSTVYEQTKEEGYYLRLIINGVTTNINSERLKDQLFKRLKIDGDVYYFYRNSLTAYYTLGIVRIDGSVLVPSVAPNSVAFSNGNLIFKGTVENVETLYVYLINTNMSATLNNYVEAEIAQDGTFTATLSLDMLIEFATSNPLNLRYKIDDLSVITINVERGNLDIAQVYAYNGKTFTFTINNSCVAVKYKDSVDEVVATYVGFENDYLVVRATAIGSYSTLTFYIQNTATSTRFDYTKEIDKIEEGGGFEVRISLAELDSASKATPLNFRVLFDENETLTPVSNGSCDLSATYEYNFRNYFITTNGNTANGKLVCIKFNVVQEDA